MPGEKEDLLHDVMLTTAGLAGVVGAVFLGRALLGQVFRWGMTRVLADTYDENLAELGSATKRVGAQNIVEISLRSEEGKAIQRPLGSPRDFPTMNELMFNMAQLHHLPTPQETPLDMSFTLGPAAKRPLQLSMPIIVSAMAYGEALSKQAKLALVKGSAQAGTAINGGEGPFLPSERKAASHYIYQYNRGHWSKEPGIIKQADAIDIQIGQGALGGAGHSVPARDIDRNLRDIMSLAPGQDAVVRARQDGTDTVEEFSELVGKLREIAGGVPIGAKIGAGMDIEKDIEFLVRSGVDFITVDGAQAATHGSAPILQDDFGLPTIYALCRATKELQRLKAKDKVSLLISGGLFTPGDFLKALALGADAVCIGTAALFALSHTQALKALPFEPPTELVWYTGKYRSKLNVKQAATALGKFLTACQEEMALGLQALGKTSLRQLSPNDLSGLTPHICEVANVRPAWKA